MNKNTYKKISTLVLTILMTLGIGISLSQNFLLNTDDSLDATQFVSNVVLFN